MRFSQVRSPFSYGLFKADNDIYSTIESSPELEQVTGGNSVNQEYMHTSMYLEWPLVQANERRMS